MSIRPYSLTTACVAAWAMCLLALPVGALDWPPELGRYEGGDMPHGMSVDCVLQDFDTCSGWIWICNDDEGAVWGTIYDTRECPGYCSSTASVSEIYLYTLCTSPSVRINSVGITSIDEQYCRSTLLYESGPITIVNCAPANHWTVLETPVIPVSGSFAVTVTWGPQVDGVGSARFALDEEYANLQCQLHPKVYGDFPGCATSEVSCQDWESHPHVSFIFVTDLDHDGVLDDVCSTYGVPLALDVGFPDGYASWANNMLMGVGLECTGPIGVEQSAWGRVKALFE